ncbi:hypothetical protein TNCV_2749581 [Trichonephila clavipes]|nr:hypothetical protein TNCV_2749581 [Trichonephila clavipes]
MSVSLVSSQASQGISLKAVSDLRSLKKSLQLFKSSIADGRGPACPPLAPALATAVIKKTNVYQRLRRGPTVFGDGRRDVQLSYEDYLRRTMFSSIDRVTAKIRERFQQLQNPEQKYAFFKACSEIGHGRT